MVMMVGQQLRISSSFLQVATVATASVAEKWDYCFNKLEILIQSKKQREPLRPSVSRMNSDEDVYEQLTGDSLRKGSNDALK